MRDPPGTAKQCLSVQISARRDVAAGIFQLETIWPGPAPRAGQFFLIKPRRSACFLGRPISVAEYDPAENRLRFLIAKRGRGTGELAALRPGDEAELTGPLGNRWEDMVPERPRAAGERAALVGGGVGIAPLLALGAELAPGSYDFYGGFKAAPFGLEGLECQDLVTASEEGLGGNQGRISDFFNPAPYRAVYACGPLPLLKAVAAACENSRTPCFISLERPMACGVGACLGCAVATRRGNRRCCIDGPLFPAHEVLFHG
ncbi:MAG: dihydroorotate dehydrogenase electron transfer subunit [Treponema sp.]|nr:dihydroorotate dehydrogenase electron transfer subunit [Treponema sp.]